MAVDGGFSCVFEARALPHNVVEPSMLEATMFATVVFRRSRVDRNSFVPCCSLLQHLQKPRVVLLQVLVRGVSGKVVDVM